MKYSFEVLVIDSDQKNELTNLEALIQTLSNAESLLLESEDEGSPILTHKNQEFQISVEAFYEDDPDELKGYILNGKSADIKTLIEQRGKLLSFLSHTLKISYIKPLGDDVSIYLSMQILPMISRVEWQMRKLLVLYYAFESGPKWWEKLAPADLKSKVSEKQSQIASLQQLVNTNIEMLSLEELGEIIDQPNRYFLETFIINRIRDIEDLDELNELKQELEDESTHPFQRAFEDKYFAEKWETLVSLHKKVAQNQLLHPNDLSVAEQLYETLMRMIQNARNLILGLEDEVEMAEGSEDVHEMGRMGMQSERMTKEEFDESPEKRNLKIITEDEILRELKETESIVEQTDMRYIGLKNFVTKILANKGYSIGPSYALINILNDQGAVEIYDYIDPHNPYPVKAVRTNL